MTLRSFHMKITLVFSQSDARITNFIVFVIKLFWHKYYLLQNIKSFKKLIRSDVSSCSSSNSSLSFKPMKIDDINNTKICDLDEQKTKEN